MSDFETMVKNDADFISVLPDSERRRELKRDLIEKVIWAIAKGEVKGLKAKYLAEYCLRALIE